MSAVPHDYPAVPRLDWYRYSRDEWRTVCGTYSILRWVETEHGCTVTCYHATGPGWSGKVHRDIDSPKPLGAARRECRDHAHLQAIRRYMARTQPA